MRPMRFGSRPIHGQKVTDLACLAHLLKKTACGISRYSERCLQRDLVIRTKELSESPCTSRRATLGCSGGLDGHASIASRASMTTWRVQTVAVTRRGGCTLARSRPISSETSTWIHRSGTHILTEHLARAISVINAPLQF